MLRTAYGAWLMLSEPPHRTTSDSLRQISYKHTREQFGVFFVCNKTKGMTSRLIILVSSSHNGHFFSNPFQHSCSNTLITTQHFYIVHNVHFLKVICLLPTLPTLYWEQFFVLFIHIHKAGRILESTVNMMQSNTTPPLWPQSKDLINISMTMSYRYYKSILYSRTVVLYFIRLYRWM